MNNMTLSLTEKPVSGPGGRLPERLFRSVIGIAAVGIVLVGGVIGFIFVETTYGNLVTQRIGEFEAATAALVRAVDGRISGMDKVATLIGNRTHIKQQLAKLSRGELSRTDVARFTAPVLEDALGQGVGVLGIARFDKGGRELVAVGEPILAAETLLPRLVGKQIYFDVPKRDGERDYVLAGIPILSHHGKRIGTDVLKFSFDVVKALLRDRVGFAEGTRVLVGGAAGVFFDSGAPGIAASVSLSELVKPSFLKTASSTSFPTEGPEGLFSVKPIKGTPWALATVISPTDLYAPVWQRLRVFIGIIVLVIVVGVAALLMVMRFASKRLQRYNAELARQVNSREETETKLRASETRFRDLIDGSVQGIFVHRDMVPLYYNEAMAKILGYGSIEELMAEGQLTAWYTPESAARLTEYQRLRFEGGAVPVRYEYEAVRKDGSSITLENVVRIVDWDGVPAVQGFVSDLSWRAEQSALEDQLRQAQKMEAVGRLAGGIAHDFNNVLGIITGFVALAMRREAQRPDETLSKYLREIATAGERGRDVVAQMMAFSRAGPSNPQRVALNPLVGEVTTMLRPVLPASLALEFIRDEKLPMVNIDPVQLQQMLINLCINARDATEGPGRIVIRTARRESHRFQCSSCEQHVEAPMVELVVSDTGNGISPEVLPRVFEPFFTTKSVGEGTGMGLAAVHGIVHQHGGHLQLESSKSGTIVRLMLPLALDQTDPEAKPMTPLATEETPSDTKDDGDRTVLVVDDEPALAELLQELLEDCGHRVLLGHSGAEALTWLRDPTERVDLVITDLTMPLMSGLELAETILAEFGNLPVIITTGYEVGQIQTGEGTNIVAVLHKPVDIDALVQQVSDSLKISSTD